MLGYSYSGKLFKEDVGLVFTVTQHLISVSKVSLYLELFIDMLITHITSHKQSVSGNPGCSTVRQKEE